VAFKIIASASQLSQGCHEGKGARFSRIHVTRKKTHGLLVRMSTKKRPLVLKRRRAKGRKRLTSAASSDIQAYERIGGAPTSGWFMRRATGSPGVTPTVHPGDALDIGRLGIARPRSWAARQEKTVAKTV